MGEDEWGLSKQTGVVVKTEAFFTSLKVSNLGSFRSSSVDAGGL